jgi:DNA (cytosine-5)-methyltransferase 1
LSFISLYTGAGGLDIGLEAAGLKAAIAVEIDTKSCATLRANQGHRLPIYEGDIHDLTSVAISETTGLAPEEPDLLIGGPPCQPFSKSAYWRSGDTKRLDDPRADTLTAYLRVLRDLKPRAFLIENVHGLMFRGKDEGLRLLRDTINAINLDTGTEYSFEVAKLNAADFGIPQTRERVFIIGSRDGKRFKFPTPTHKDPTGEETVCITKRWRTAWDAIGDLNDLEDPTLKVGGRWGDLLASIPDGENYLYHTDRGGGLPLFGWRRRYWGFLLKLAKDRPAWTVQAQPGTSIGPFHWRSRRLSTRELCRIQTFPDNYQIIGGRSDVQRQLGNAVPSLLAEILGREIRTQLLGQKRSNLKLKLALAPRGAPGKPERLKPVPKKYHVHIGEHEAHPGTGRGFSFSGR